MKYEEMKRWDKMSILTPLIIEQLQKLGGKTSRKKLRNELRENAKDIPEYAFDEYKIGKNGNTYSPIDIIIAFTIKNLEIAGYLVYPERGILSLTEKGILFDRNQFSMDKDIIPPITTYWNEHKGNRKKNQIEDGIDILDEKEDEAELPEEIAKDEIPKETWEVQLKKELLKMPPKNFELFCRKMLEVMGIELDEDLGVSAVRDGGIDGFGYYESDDFRTSRVAIQAKRWKDESTVGSPEIDKFRGAIDKFNAEYGIFITTSKFSRDAIAASKQGSRVITLIDGDKIIELVRKYEFCLKKQVVLDEQYFSSINI